MKKNLIICGVPRSGKTFLSKKVSTEIGLSHLHIDSLIDAFQKVYPKLEISHDGESHAQICAALQPFLFEWINRLAYYHVGFVLDTYHLLLSEVIALKGACNLEILCLGYPDIDSAGKLAEVRGYSCPPDWTAIYTDEVMLKSIESFSRHSQRMREECKCLGINFVDTGVDFLKAINETKERLLDLSHDYEEGIS